MDYSKHISSARQLSIALIVLGVIALQISWTEYERRNRLSSFEVVEFAMKVIDAVADIKEPPLEDYEGESKVVAMSGIPITLRAYPGERCAIDILWGAAVCGSSQREVGLALVYIRDCPIDLSPLIVSAKTDLFLPPSVANKLGAPFVDKQANNPLTHTMSCASNGLEGQVPPISESVWSIVYGAELSAHVLLQTARVFEVLYDAQQVDLAFNALFSKEDIDPVIFGFELNRRIVVMGIPLLFLTIVVGLRHRLKRVARRPQDESEPWILINPTDWVERGAAIVWVSISFASGIAVLAVAILFSAHLTITIGAVTLTIFAWVLLLDCVRIFWRLSRST